VQRGNHFAETSTRARQTIAELGARFIRNGTRVLTHGHSRVVLALLRLAVKQGIQFDVVVTEGRVGAVAAVLPIWRPPEGHWFLCGKFRDHGRVALQLLLTCLYMSCLCAAERPWTFS